MEAEQSHVIQENSNLSQQLYVLKTKFQKGSESGGDENKNL